MRIIEVIRPRHAIVTVLIFRIIEKMVVLVTSFLICRNICKDCEGQKFLGDLRSNLINFDKLLTCDNAKKNSVFAGQKLVVRYSHSKGKDKENKKANK